MPLLFISEITASDILLIYTAANSTKCSLFCNFREVMLSVARRTRVVC